MPINNALNKRSDTFLATTNLTINSSTPILSTITNTGTYANAISVLTTAATRQASINLEYISNLSTNGPYIHMLTARGTPSSPAQVTGTNNLLGKFSFNAYDGTIYQEISKIECLGIPGQIIFTTGQTYLAIRDAPSDPIRRQIDSNSMIVMTQSAYNTLSVSGFTTDSSGFIQARTASGESPATQTFIGLSHFNFSASTNQGASLVLVRSRNSTPALTTKVESGDEIGQIVFVGADGTSTAKQMGWIKCFADGATGSSDVPGRLTFATTPDGTATPSEAMNINNSGCITQIRQPSFSASLSADVAAATGDGTAYVVALNVEQYDQGANFAANTFTAPVTGRYRFNYTLSVDDLAVGHTKLELTIGGRMVERCNPYALADSDGFALFSGSVDLSLSATNTVTMVVTISGSTKTVTVKGTTSSGTFLSGQLQV